MFIVADLVSLTIEMQQLVEEYKMCQFNLIITHASINTHYMVYGLFQQYEPIKWCNFIIYIDALCI